MLNYCCDSPPETITVNGGEYPVNTDFRVWIRITRLFRELQGASPEDLRETICALEREAFGRLIDEPWQGVLAGMSVFLRGYPQVDNGASRDVQAPAYSFEHDLNYIALAIRNQSGIDLSWRRTEPFHWWLFLLEFQTLEARHYIRELMQLRSYTGSDPEMLKAKHAVALPPEHTKSELLILDELEDLFYNS